MSFNQGMLLGIFGELKIISKPHLGGVIGVTETAKPQKYGSKTAKPQINAPQNRKTAHKYSPKPKTDCKNGPNLKMQINQLPSYYIALSTSFVS